MTPAEQKAFEQMREALESSAVCIQLMSDGPSRASWGDTLDIIDSAITAANAVSVMGNPITEPVPHSGADEKPPVFGRRWKIAADGFGLQRDDLNGRYVDIDDALSVLHATHPQATEPAWRPIESAPKDGTPIIIAVVGEGVVYDVCNGHFEIVLEDEDDGPWDIRDGKPWCSYEGRAEGVYFCCWLPGKEWESRWRVTENFEYTHWMPLPASPEAHHGK